MIVLLGLLSALCGEPGLCLEEDGSFTFDGDIRQFAVDSNTVYISTEERLYQLSHDLTLINSLTQRGILKNTDDQGDPTFYRVSETAAWNATFRVNLLLPFRSNDSLIICGVTDDDCGHCEVLKLKNISNLLYSEHIQVGPLKRSSASVSFLVDVKKETQTDTYILTAIQQHKEETGSINAKTINLQNTNKKQRGGIFSLNDGSSVTPVIRSKGVVEFVDGFQINSTIYLFSNVLSAQSNRVRLIWFEGEKSKTETLRSLRGATLSISDGEGSRLVASSVIPGGQPVLWSGVFSVDGGHSNTELMVFDISPDHSRDPDRDPDFYTSAHTPGVKTKTLKPKAVLFRKSYMTSVLAVRQRAWMVFFIGTGDGQLIKLSVDRNFHAACPTVLYRASEDRQVFPKLHLDPVDHKHVYVPFRNQMKRVPVSKCSTYTDVQQCWSAQDPHCVWCGSKRSCTFEADCTDSDWLSISDESHQKIVSHRVEKDKNGEFLLKIHTHLSVGQKALSNFACQFSSPSCQLCSQNNPRPQFPQCTCILNGAIPSDGLHVTVRFRVGMTSPSAQLTLTNCSAIIGPPTFVLCQECIQAGCGWSRGGCSWANEGDTDASACQNLAYGMNCRPEISSITPSVVSFYGRNNAVLSGRNLDNVTRVRIQTRADCALTESPVWSKTSVSLLFHIPSSDIKGVVSVCVVLPDGSCHGGAKLTYRSLPSCTSISPSNSWLSGGRKITLTGSHLELVEGVVHSHAMQEVRLPTSSNSQILTYDTPAAKVPQSNTTVYLKVANQTLACAGKITYYPDPEFTSFTATWTEDNVYITLQKKADKLEMATEELSLWGAEDKKEYLCINEGREISNITDSFTCVIKSLPSSEFQELLVEYGAGAVRLVAPFSFRKHLPITVYMLILCVMASMVIIYLCRTRRTRSRNYSRPPKPISAQL